MRLACALEQDVVMRRDTAIGLSYQSVGEGMCCFCCFMVCLFNVYAFPYEGGYVCGRFSNNLFSNK